MSVFRAALIAHAEARYRAVGPILTAPWRLARRAFAMLKTWKADR